jgi:hypothetical protein
VDLILGVDSRVEFISSCLDLTGPTGTTNWLEWCHIVCGFALGEHLVAWGFALSNPRLVLANIQVGLPRFVKLLVSLTSLVLSWFMFQSLDTSLRLFGMVVVRLPQQLV